MKNKNNVRKFSHDDALEYVEALKAPWQTMQRDISFAMEIIQAEAAENITFINKIEQVDNEIHFSFPDWHAPVEAHFIAQYGKAEGSFIFDKVVMQLFKRAQGETNYVH